MPSFWYFVVFFAFFVGTLFTIRYNNLYLQAIAFFTIAMCFFITKRLYFSDNLYILWMGYSFLGIGLAKTIHKDIKCLPLKQGEKDYLIQFFYLYVYGFSIIDLFIIIEIHFEYMPVMSSILTLIILIINISTFILYGCYHIFYIIGVLLLLIGTILTVIYLNVLMYEILPSFNHIFISGGLIFYIIGAIQKMRCKKKCQYYK